MQLLERNYELKDEELIAKIHKEHKRIDIIYLMQRYIEAPTDYIRNELKKISQSNFKKLDARIDECLKVTIDNKLTHLLVVDATFFLKTMGLDEYKEFKNTDTYKIFDKYVFPVSFRISNLNLSIIIKQLLACKNLDGSKHYDILIKSFNIAIKQLDKIKETYNLDIKTINYFTKGLLKDISYTVDSIFNAERFIKFNNDFSKLTDELSTLNHSFYIAKGNDEERERLHKDIEALEDELTNISNKEYDNIIGYNEVNGIYEINPDTVKFNIEELKRMIKSRFNICNNDESNKEQLKYVLWIMQLTANEKTDTLPFQDKFILDNMIIPWSQELRELLGEDFDNTNFNIEEAIKYINRLRTDGEYKSQYYKTKALKRVFGYGDEACEVEINKLVKLDMSREYINSEASNIGMLMLNSLLEDGELVKEYSIKEYSKIANKSIDKKMVFIKKGNAISDQALNLLHYLIGEIEDNALNTSTNSGMKFYKTEFCRAIKKELRGKKWGYISDLVYELQQVQFRILTHEEYEKHLKSNRRMKSIPLFTYQELDINGDDTKLEFDIPLLKYLRGIGKFRRDINRDITEVIFTKPRVYKIARYAVMESFRNENFVERKIDTLINSIGETEKYNAYSNKRKYLQYLFNDVCKANTYLLNGVSIKMDKCNEGNKAQSRVSISGTSKLVLKNKKNKKNKKF